MSAARKSAIVHKTWDTVEGRQARAIGILAASIWYKDQKGADHTAILGLADGFAEYIMGSGNLPVPDLK